MQILNELMSMLPIAVKWSIVETDMVFNNFLLYNLFTNLHTIENEITVSNICKPFTSRNGKGIIIKTLVFCV